MTTYKLNDDSEVSATNKTICTEGQHTIKYKVCNNAGTCNETSNSYVNLDHTKPNIELLVYQGSNDDVNTLDSIEKINTALWVDGMIAPTGEPALLNAQRKRKLCRS